MTPAQVLTPVTPRGNGTFYNPNAPPGTQPALPAAPAGDSGPEGPVPLLPEIDSVVISYAGQVVPLLDINGVSNTNTPFAQGEVFAINHTGQVAAVGGDHQLYVNGAPMTVSPASQFGLPPNLSVRDIVWSPDGHRLALRVDAANPNERNAISSGIWIYEPGSNRSWQVLRTTYEGQVAQLHQQQRPVAIQWSPDGNGLVITVETPLGRGNVVTSTFRDINNPDFNDLLDPLPYPYATWGVNSQTLIVSGTKWGEPTSVVGRIVIDKNWAYTSYFTQAVTTFVEIFSAVELYNGQIAFLGEVEPATFALYLGAPNVQPERVSPLLEGHVLSVEWNPERTAALITASTEAGLRLWIVRIDGTAQDVTPLSGYPTAVHWR